jgi:hypothetical protein
LIGDEKSLAVLALTSSSSCHNSASPGRESKRSGAEKKNAGLGRRRTGHPYAAAPGTTH